MIYYPRNMESVLGVNIGDMIEHLFATKVNLVIDESNLKDEK